MLWLATTLFLGPGSCDVRPLGLGHVEDVSGVIFVSGWLGPWASALRLVQDRGFPLNCVLFAGQEIQKNERPTVVHNRSCFSVCSWVESNRKQVYAARVKHLNEFEATRKNAESNIVAF